MNRRVINKNKLHKNSLLLILCVLGSFFMLPSFAQTMEASPRKVEVKVGETFEIEYILTNSPKGLFNPPDLSNFTVVGGPNSFESTQWDSRTRKRQSVRRFTYKLLARKAGNLPLKGASYKTKRKTLKAKDISVLVSPGDGKGEANKDPNAAAEVTENLPDVFYRVETDTTKTYLGQQITVSYILYTTYSLTNYNSLNAPALQGFWAHDISPKRITGQNLVTGTKVYNKYLIKKYALFPQRTGELELDPMELEISVRMPSGGRRNTFNYYRNQTKRVKSETKKIAVYPLPEKNKPDSFSGMVGNFKINVRTDKTSCKQNETINLNIGVIGSGNLKLIEPFQLQLPDEFEVYDPTVSENIYEKNSTVMGSKSFEYLIIPRKSGKLTIPSLPFTYYNPEAQRYEVKNSAPITIDVSPGDASDTAAQEEETAITDIIGLQTTDKLKSYKKTMLPLLALGGLYLIPFFLLPALIRRKRKEDLENSDVLSLKRKAALGVAKSKLETAQAFKSKGEKKGFYDEVIRAIWGYLEDRVNIPTSELSKENITSVLKNKGVSTEKSKNLIEVISYCEMALFAPVADADNLQKTYDNTLQTIADIEEELK